MVISEKIVSDMRKEIGKKCSDYIMRDNCFLVVTFVFQSIEYLAIILLSRIIVRCSFFLIFPIFFNHRTEATLAKVRHVREQYLFSGIMCPLSLCSRSFVCAVSARINDTRLARQDQLAPSRNAGV